MQRSKQFALLAAIALAICYLILASIAVAQSGPKQTFTHDINGFIRVGNTPAPAGVLVQLMRYDGGGEFDQTSSDARGRFEFRGVPTGIYNITAHLEGYRDASYQVDLRYSRSLITQLELERVPTTAEVAVPPGGTVDRTSARLPTSRDASKALMDGERLLFEKNDAKASIEKLKKVIELEPDYVPAYVLVGTAYTAIGDWKQAQSAFDEAVKREPEDAAAWLGSGAALNQQHEYAMAEQKLRKCNELNENLPEGHYELGRSLWALGRWREAEPEVRRTLELDGNHVLAHALLGNILLKKNDKPGAIAEFNEFLRLQPKGPAADQVRQAVAKLNVQKQ